MAQHRLTTIDNPFDPFDDFDRWNAFDRKQGYETASLLARVAYNSEDLSETDQNLADEEAIDDIIRVDPLLMYKKVSR